MLCDPSQARTLLADALARRYAVLAVNADSPAALVDCLEAARGCAAPVIVETSLWQLTGRSFGAGDPGLGMVRYLLDLGALAASARYREVPVIYHTDHIKGPETLALLGRAVQGLPVSFPGGEQVTLTPSTVSLDSSELSAEANVASIAALCRQAAAAGRDVTLEMEAGVDDGVTETAVTGRLLGDVERQHPGKVALWAPGLGTRHGYSAEGYPAFSPDAVARHRDAARRATGREVGIALHGSSGLSAESLGAAVARGVVKVNWSTESLLLRSGAAADYYGRHAAELTPGHPRFKPTAMDHGLQEFVAGRYVPVVAAKIRALGGEGKAPGLPFLAAASSSPAAAAGRSHPATAAVAAAPPVLAP